MPTAFMGMRGTGDFAANQVPEKWDQYILREYPNGSAPLYAMQSMYKKETTDSHSFHWWDKSLPTQSGTVSSVYIDTDLGTEYDHATHALTNGVAGSVLYVKVAVALAKEFNPGALARLIDTDQYTVEVRGRVVSTFYNGDSSYIAIALLEDDDNGGATYNIATVDRILRYGSAYPDGSTAPEGIVYDPDPYENYVQNYRNTFDMTVEAISERLRTGSSYAEDKKDCMELHSIDIEKSAFWGIKTEGTGDNGQPLRTTQGIIPFLEENYSTNVLDYVSAAGVDYAGKTWLQAGKKFLNTYFTQLFRYLSGGEVMCFCGDGALLGIQELAEAFGEIKLVPGAKSYGLDVTTWQVPAGRVHFKTHPLFSHETTNQNLMVLGHPKNAKFVPKVAGGYNFNTTFEKDMQIPGQHSKVDGFSTKAGWKWRMPRQWMVLRGIGLANTA